MENSHDPSDDIAHAPTSVTSQHLNRNDLRRLRHPIFLARDRSCTMRPMPIPILIHIIFRDRLSPHCATLEFDMVNVDTGINDVGIHTLSTLWVVRVLSHGRQAEFGTMGDPRETPWSTAFGGDAGLVGRGGERIVYTLGDILGPDDLVMLDISHIGGRADGVQSVFCELSG